MTHSAQTSDAAGSAGILARGANRAIAYNRLPGKVPGIVFLHGFRSDQGGTKALAIEGFCRRRGQAFVRFDATGHGASSGRFEDGTISQWTTDAIDVIDALTDGPQVLVGSSMGGWLMLLAALERRHRIAGLMGLAAAPDFIEELIVAAFSPDQRAALLREGQVTIPGDDDLGPCPISRALVEDGRRNLLLSAPINLFCPVRLIHGQKDADVPWRTALRLADALASDDVAVTLVKSAGHRLSEPADLARIETALEALLRQLEAGQD